MIKIVQKILYNDSHENKSMRIEIYFLGIKIITFIKRPVKELRID